MSSSPSEYPDDIDCTLWYTFDEASSGNASAQVKLGLAYLDGKQATKSCDKAVKWFKKAAGQDDSQGQRYLAYCYHEGLGVSKSLEEALRLYGLSASSGNPRSTFCLYVMYSKGEGCIRDKRKAMQWLKKARELGDPLAICEGLESRPSTIKSYEKSI